MSLKWTAVLQADPACNCSEEWEAGKAVQAGSSGRTRDGAGEDSVGVPGGREGAGIWWGHGCAPAVSVHGLPSSGVRPGIALGVHK